MIHNYLNFIGCPFIGSIVHELGTKSMIKKLTPNIIIFYLRNSFSL